MTRNGKIARLPHAVRHQINRRLQDGEPGKDLVAWLNPLPEVQKVMHEEFGGRPISEQNLSEWKQGGYRDWERHEESCALVRQLARQTDDLADEAGGVEVSHRLATVLAVELARVSEALLEQAADPQERWRRLREVLRELTQLRQEDRKEGWLALERERRGEELERRHEEERERRLKEMKEKVCAPIWAKLQLEPLAKMFGGGETGGEVAAFLMEVQHDLPRGTLTGRLRSEPVQPAQTESNPIKPDQTGTASPPLEQVG